MFAPHESKSSPAIQGWNQLRPQLQGIDPRQLIVVSDMTGTLVTQTENGMLPTMRESHRALFERGMMLVLATADSGHSVKEFYLNPLGRVDDRNLYVVHSVGAWRGRVANGEFHEVSRGLDISETDRRILLGAMERSLASHLGMSGGVFSFTERDHIISSSERVALQGYSSLMGPQSFIEILPSKAAIFFLEDKIAGPLQQSIFSEYVADPAVQDVVKRGGYELIRGGNYVDICTCTKEEGVRDVLQRFQPTDRRSLIVLGDSENDLGILSQHYEGFDTVMRVFVGQSEAVQDALMKGPFAREFFLLPGEHCAGSARLFEALGASV